MTTCSKKKKHYEAFFKELHELCAKYNVRDICSGGSCQWMAWFGPGCQLVKCKTEGEKCEILF